MTSCDITHCRRGNNADLLEFEVGTCEGEGIGEVGKGGGGGGREGVAGGEG